MDQTVRWIRFHLPVSNLGCSNGSFFFCKKLCLIAYCAILVVTVSVIHSIHVCLCIILTIQEITSPDILNVQFDETFNEKEVPKRGRGRGRGGRGRGRGNHQYNNQQYQNHQPHYNHHGNNHHGGNRGGAHPVGTPPHNLINKPEQHQQLPIGASKLPPGPRMPDGTRGFTMGRGKPQAVLPGLCAVGEP